jgi:hypothetical protein
MLLIFLMWIDFFIWTEETKEYVRIFTDIERLDQLQNYYVRCHKVGLIILYHLLCQYFDMYLK